MGWLVLLCAVGPPTLRGVDAHGDPLPVGAMMRLGTTRFRHPIDNSFYPRLLPSPDGTALLAMSNAGLSIFRLPAGELIRRDSSVCDVGFRSGGKQIVTLHLDPRPPEHRGKYGMSMRVLTWPALEAVRETKWGVPSPGVGRPGGDTQYAFLSPDGATAFYGGGIVEARLYDTTTGRAFAKFEPPVSWVTRPVFTADGRGLLAWSERGPCLVEASSGKVVRTLLTAREDDERGGIFSPALAPDGKTTILHGPDGLYRVRLADGRVEAKREGAFWGCAFSPDGATLACIGLDERVHLLDPKTLVPRRTIAPYGEDWPHCLAFSPDAKTLFVGHDQHIALWDVLTGRRIPQPAGHDRAVTALAWSPDNATLTSGGADGTAILWDAVTGRPRRTLHGHEQAVTGIAFSADGRTIATGEGPADDPGWAGAEARVRLWDVATGAKRLDFVAHLGRTRSLVFSPDGRTLVSTAGDNRVRWWDTTTGLRLAQARHLFAPRVLGFARGLAVVYQADGGLTRLAPDAVASTDRRKPDSSFASLLPGGAEALVQRGDLIHRTQVESGKSLASIPFSRHDIHGAVCSPDGRLIAYRPYAIDDTVLRDLVTNREVGRLGIDSWGGALAFSPDGRTLATGLGTTEVFLWDVEHLPGRRGR